MSVKKLLVLAAAGITMLGAAVALAGGPDVGPDLVPTPSAFQPNIYIDGQFGNAWVNWRNFNNSLFFATRTNSEGGFTGGADVGYNFTEYLGLEFGGYILPDVTGTVLVNTIPISALPLRLSSWFVYLGPTLTLPVPVFHDLSLFGKVAIGYRDLSYASTGAAFLPRRDDSNWEPVFAAGAKYQINDNWRVGIQYMYFPGHTNASPITQASASANILTGFVGYQFSV